jgi:hypothetical protein
LFQRDWGRTQNSGRSGRATYPSRLYPRNDGHNDLKSWIQSF